MISVYSKLLCQPKVCFSFFFIQLNFLEFLKNVNGLFLFTPYCKCIASLFCCNFAVIISYSLSLSLSLSLDTTFVVWMSSSLSLHKSTYLCDPIYLLDLRDLWCCKKCKTFLSWSRPQTFLTIKTRKYATKWLLSISFILQPNYSKLNDQKKHKSFPDSGISPLLFCCSIKLYKKQEEQPSKNCDLAL
jgi:hypothetical protein